ncbi:ABC1-domain-containing protein [Rhypophila decipiens]|uniref:ABC1-domain-containing protein n=1 Tax=Rhypophila decipiens TaxID=261697 RepID=A0AAN7B7S0_9PEZI|nr:ABC1-domain-containing protein [Rhypophila decipiens]
MRFADLLLDLAAVASASRSVASKHVALRGRQVDRYRKTSSIVTAAASEAKKSPAHHGHETTPLQDDAVEARINETYEQDAPFTQADEAIYESQPGTSKSSAGTVDAIVEKPAQPLSREVESKLQADTIPASSSSAPGSQKPKFTPAPWASGTPLLTAFPPPRRPPVPLEGGQAGAGILEDSIYKIGKKGLRIMDALEEAAAEAKKMEEEERKIKDEVDTVVDRTESLKKEDLGSPATSVPHASGSQKVVEGSSPVEPTVGTNTMPPNEEEDANMVADLSSPSASSSAPRYELRESRVPSSRIGRLWNYGGLAAGMFAGTISEGLSRAVGGGSQGSMMLSPANMERLVAKLSRMRGAALKLGQMMSFQDAKMLPPPIQEVLQRVQDRADYMPAWQRDGVLKANLGADWRDLFGEFEEKPIAAASIGQVHRATLKATGAKVAVKIQFPGVADSINSDLDNIAILLAATKLLPKGLYLNKTIDNARTELGWECDYLREAECGQRYRKLLTSPQNPSEWNDVFVVPQIYPEASGKQVITMEFMQGVGVTRMISDFSQAQRDWIGTQILRLCLREIAEFKFMQTDPNWTNFLYNSQTQKLELLDFGASREYPPEFIDKYLRLLEAASRGDRERVKVFSEELGYLTGHESKAMLDAHITSVSTLAEPFLRDAPEVYDFRDQTITERVKAQIPVMIHERLAPPPEETYSLHRKLSGAFLLCARLGSRVRCRELFEDALGKTGMEFP